MPFSSQSVSSRGLCWVKISIQMKVKVGLSGSREGLPKVVWQIRVAQTPCLQHAATKKFHGRIAILRLWCAVRLCNSLLRKTLGKRRRFSNSNFLPTKDKWAGQATGAKRRGNYHRLAQRQSFPKVIMWAKSNTGVDPYPGRLQEPKGWWSNNDNVMWNRTSWRWSYGQHTRCWRKPYLQWRGAHSKSNRPFKPTMNLILMHLVIIDSLVWLLPQGNKLLHPETTAWKREKEQL